jgi:acyl-CoA thioesterase I
MRKILFFGDSLTAGYGLASPGTESFPALIQKKIKEAHLAYSVINGGLSGDTSSGGLSRLDYWISTPIDIFILELGINDVIRGLPTTSTYHNLDNILKRVRKKHPQCKIAIMGMEIPSFISSTKIDEFRGIFGRLAEIHEATFVPFFLEGVMGVKHLNLRDGLHPSSRGYEVIADKVWPVVEKLLEQ